MAFKMRVTMSNVMKSAVLAVSILVGAAMPDTGNAQNARELSAPIVAYTGVIKANADALELTEAQRADLAEWINTAPAKRKVVEAEALAARAALRNAINAGLPRVERLKLADRIGALEAQLVMMRSDCTDHWRSVLTEEQFTRMLAMARN
jgi:hypothetical protein